MKKDFTEIVFILDRSGSMAGLESDTIGGFNGLLEKQKKEKGDAILTTVLFDDRYELLHDRINIKGVASITSKEYFVRGSTALIDAIGKTLSKIDNAHEHTLEEEKPENVIFVIITDGMENASRNYSYDSIKEIIESKKKLGWEFMFLGANIDAIAEGEKMGIDRNRSVDFKADKKGVNLNYKVMCDTISFLRSEKMIDESWKEEIEKEK